MLQKITLFAILCFLFCYKCTDTNYRTIYGNTFLVNDPRDFCGNSPLQNIYYVTQANGIAYLGYVKPTEILFCGERAFILNGEFKDFYDNVLCYGLFYSAITDEDIQTFFVVANPEAHPTCADTDLKLYRKMTLGMKVYYQLEWRWLQLTKAWE